MKKLHNRDNYSLGASLEGWESAAAPQHQEGFEGLILHDRSSSSPPDLPAFAGTLASDMEQMHVHVNVI